MADDANVLFRTLKKRFYIMKKKMLIFTIIFVVLSMIIFFRLYTRFNYLSGFFDCTKGKFQKALLEEPKEIVLIETKVGEKFGIKVLNLYRYDRLSRIQYDRKGIKNYNKIMFYMYSKKYGKEKLEEYNLSLDSMMQGKVFFIK